MTGQRYLYLKTLALSNSWCGNLFALDSPHEKDTSLLHAREGRL